MEQHPVWYERAGFAKKTDLHEPSLIEIFNELDIRQNDFLAQISRNNIEWNLPWPRDPLHQWSRRWEYPYVASSIPKTPALVLDAGSGFTFFPFYVAGLGHQVYAVDHDPQLKKYYDALSSSYGVSTKGNKTSAKGKLDFSIQDLSSLSFQANNFDLIYCVSVLEHLSGKEAVLNEFARILKPGGTLILTCDISLDGSVDVSLTGFYDMLKVIDSLFEYSSVPSFQMDGDTLTTNYCQKESPEQLPWLKPRFRLRWLIHPSFYIQHERFTKANFHSLAVAGVKLSVK